MSSPFGKKDNIVNPFESKEKAEVDLEAIVIKEDKKVELITQQNKSRKQLILESCGGLESNVPINSPYWRMKG